MFTIAADGTDLRQITHVGFTAPRRGAEQPDWSPGGAAIAFAAPAGGGTALFTMRPDGSRMARVPLRLRGASAAPAYSPDGARIAFDHDGAIFVARADGSVPRRVTSPPATAHDTAATWSPDGTRLCFTRVRSPRESALHVVRLDGSGLRRLTAWSLDASAASWSRAGIAFESYSRPRPGASANLFTIRPDGGGLRQLTRFSGGGTQAFGPAWSPDGRLIVWHKISQRVDQLFVMNARGREQRQLTRLAGDARVSHAAWGG